MMAIDNKLTVYVVNSDFKVVSFDLSEQQYFENDGFYYSGHWYPSYTWNLVYEKALILSHSLYRECTA